MHLLLFSKKIFSCFWLHWVFVAACVLSLVAVSQGFSLLRGFSLRWPFLLQSTGSRLEGFSRCGTWAQQLGSRVWAQYSWHGGLVAPRHVGSSWTQIEPVSPALAGEFSTTSPPEKPPKVHFIMIYKQVVVFMKLRQK